MAIKSTLLVSVLVAFLAVVALVWFYSTHPMAPKTTKPITQVHIGSTAVQVEVADTESLREQGLSGRASLEAGHGMLFVFDSPVIPGFWMKDMRFSLDMIFADSSGKIVTIDSDISPSTYLQNPPEVFRPSAPVIYVLEVPAGFAAQNKIEVGQVMKLQ